MDTNYLEKRSITDISVGDNDTVQGYAVVFNSLSEDLGGFREIIDPCALDGVILRSDVFAVLDHDRSRGVLARSKYGIGSLSLSVDEKGLFYRFTLPPTTVGCELKSHFERGEIDGASFSFTVNSDKWERGNNGECIRTVLKIARLFDVSPVFSPAYADTTVALRRLNDWETFKRKRELTAQQIKAFEENEAVKRATNYQFRKRLF